MKERKDVDEILKAGEHVGDYGIHHDYNPKVEEVSESVYDLIENKGSIMFLDREKINFLRNSSDEAIADEINKRTDNGEKISSVIAEIMGRA